MKTPTPTAGYLLKASYWEQVDQNTTKLFISEELLITRKAAFYFAQTLADHKEPADVLDITIHLVELDTEKVITTTIAQVYSYRFHRSKHTPEEDAFTIHLTLDTNDNEEVLTSPLELTLDVTKVDEAFDSPKAIRSRLGELSCEYEYYHSYDHTPGIGVMELVLAGPDDPATLNEVTRIRSHEELIQIQKKYRKSLPYSMYWVLYDALAYVSSLVEGYNKHYAYQREHLALVTKVVEE